jgi:hypothetical protein
LQFARFHGLVLAGVNVDFEDAFGNATTPIVDRACCWLEGSKPRRGERQPHPLMMMAISIVSPPVEVLVHLAPPTIMALALIKIS